MNEQENLEEVMEQGLDHDGDTTSGEGRILSPEENPLKHIGAKEMGNLLKSITDMIRICKDTWTMIQEQFAVKEDDMKQIHVFNENHYDPMPEGLTFEEQQAYDRYNGIDKMTEADVKEIFGDEHPIYGETFEETMENVKLSANTFFSLVDAHKEYVGVEKAYQEYTRLEMQSNIDRIKKAIAVTDDPEKRAELQYIVDTHESRQYIGFIADPIPDEDRNHIINAFSNPKTVNYWMSCAEKKLAQLKVDKSFFFLLTNIENDYLDEKYHEQTNTFFLYFVQILVYKAKINDPHDEWRAKAAAIVFAINSLRRNQYSDTDKEKIIENLTKFSDQFIGSITYDNNSLRNTASVADTLPQVDKEGARIDN